MTHALALAACLLAIACTNDDRVGQRCIIGGDAGPDEVIVVASPSLDCPSRACLHMPGGQDMCTAECESADDCEKVAGSPCEHGFACAIPVVVGPFACKRMCVCRDDLDGQIASPEVCR